MATKYKNAYFIGIGGIGMSAIARYFKFKGLNVAGYDRTESELTDTLQKEGIDVHYVDNVDFIPKDIENTLVVYTPAIPHDLKELKYVMDNGYNVFKRSKVHKYIDSTHIGRKRRGLLGIFGRNLEKLRHEPSYEPHADSRGGSRRIRQVVLAAASGNRGHYCDGC